MKWLWKILLPLKEQAKREPVAIIMILLTLMGLWLNNDTADRNIKSSDKQYEDQKSQTDNIAKNEIIVKEKLNNIEKIQADFLHEQASSLDKMSIFMNYYVQGMSNLVNNTKNQEKIMHSMNDLIAAYTDNTKELAVATGHYAGIAEKSYALSEANVAVDGKLYSFPYRNFKETGHVDMYDDNDIVILGFIILRNKSQYPIEVLNFQCKSANGTIMERGWCNPKYIFSDDERIVWFKNPQLIEDDFIKKYSAEEIQEKYSHLGKYYNGFSEYPLSFSMEPFEEKIGYVFFHGKEIYTGKNLAVKVLLTTNREDFYKDFTVLPENELYESLSDSIIGSEINKKILDESAPMFFQLE